jgi:hypothetical protein
MALCTSHNHEGRPVPLEPAQPRTHQPWPPMAGPRVQRPPHPLWPWRGAKQSQPSRAVGPAKPRAPHGPPHGGEVGGGSAGDDSSLSSAGYAGQSWLDTSTGAVTVDDITNCSDTSNGAPVQVPLAASHCSDYVIGAVSVAAAGGGSTAARRRHCQTRGWPCPCSVSSSRAMQLLSCPCSVSFLQAARREPCPCLVAQWRPCPCPVSSSLATKKNSCIASGQAKVG